MASLNITAAPITMSDTSEHVILPDTDLMVDPKQPNVNVGLTLSTLASSTLAGTWKVYVSNNSHLVASADARWADISSAFSPAIAGQLSGSSDQYIQLGPVYARAIRVTFTPTSGSGSAVVGLMAQPALGPTLLSAGN